MIADGLRVRIIVGVALAVEISGSHRLDRGVLSFRGASPFVGGFHPWRGWKARQRRTTVALVDGSRKNTLLFLFVWVLFDLVI